MLLHNNPKTLSLATTDIYNLTVSEVQEPRRGLADGPGSGFLVSLQSNLTQYQDILWQLPETEKNKDTGIWVKSSLKFLLSLSIISEISQLYFVRS